MTPGTRELVITVLAVLCIWIGLAVVAVANPRLGMDVAVSAIAFGGGLLWAAYLGARSGRG